MGVDHLRAQRHGDGERRTRRQRHHRGRPDRRSRRRSAAASSSAPAQEGVAVKKGDVLYKLDDSLLQAAASTQAHGRASRAARANYRHVKKDSDSNKADKAAAKAQCDQAKVAREDGAACSSATRRSPRRSTACSPTSPSAPGENAVPGNTLAIVSDVANLYVTIYVPENRIGEVKIGQTGTLDDRLDRRRPTPPRSPTSRPQAEFTPASIETKDQRVKLVYQVKLRRHRRRRRAQAGHARRRGAQVTDAALNRRARDRRPRALARSSGRSSRSTTSR